MACEIGQNIFKLRKKNKELLDLLESNSTLLENKIKMLRKVTRTSRESDIQGDVPSSPLKRRYESSTNKNSSGCISVALTKDAPEISSNRDAVEFNYENNTEKSCLPDTKKIPIKRVRHTSVLKSDVKKCLGKQAKKRISKKQENIDQCDSQGFYIEQPENRIQHHKTKSKAEKNTKTKTTKHLRESVNIQHLCQDSITAGDKTETEDELTMHINTCTKCLNEARCLLHYSPESVFLQRMKHRLQKSLNESTHKDCSKINQMCNCEMSSTQTSDEESNHSCLEEIDSLISDPENRTQPCDTGRVKEHYNAQSLNLECENKKLCNCHSNKIAYKDAQIQTSRLLIDIPSENVPPKGTLLKKKCSIKCQKDIRVLGNKSQKHILKRGCSIKRSEHDGQSRRCLCKKQVGGLCCCEVRRQFNQRNGTIIPLNGDAKFSVPLVSTVSSPVIPILKPKEKPVSRCGLPQNCKCKSDQQKSRTLNEIPTAGHDVIVGVMENDHKKYIADPCTYQIEELSHFRQKHWFDCHAHPHVASVSDICVDVKECHDQTGALDDDLMQPTLDPCVRSYRLNQRLFPETTKEKHSASCCIAGEKRCISPRLLPTQRRLITLPSFPQQYAKQYGETMKTPPGMHAFPQSNVLICDPLPSNKPHTGSATPRRLRRPVPNNSLALRFQKGVA